MPELEQLRANHGLVVLDFELENRANFVISASDRGDEFFVRFAEDFDRVLAEQEAGTCAFHVLVDDDAAGVGRFNLYGVGDGAATVNIG